MEEEKHETPAEEKKETPAKQEHEKREGIELHAHKRLGGSKHSKPGAKENRLGLKKSGKKR